VHLINFSMTTTSSPRPRPHFPVSAPQEATLDSAFLLTASNMHAAKARAMKAGAGAFDIDDFVSKLITFMGGRRGGGGGGGAGPKDRRDRQADADYDEDVDDDEEDDDEDDEPLNWERIGRKALAKSRRIPVMDFMCVIIHHPRGVCLRCFYVRGGL
jgi:non-structural maintenance of chromosomes element 4